MCRFCLQAQEIRRFDGKKLESGMNSDLVALKATVKVS